MLRLHLRECVCVGWRGYSAGELVETKSLSKSKSQWFLYRGDSWLKRMPLLAWTPYDSR